jgi:hypothetical protein
MSEDIGDDRLVRVFVKIRTKLAELSREYDAAKKVLTDQRNVVEAELLKRLHARNATQTKTEEGTAFIKENTTITIADEVAFGSFVIEQQDYAFYQKRAKVEHVQEYMKEHEGRLPPGLSAFREMSINVRAPGAKEKQ